MSHYSCSLHSSRVSLHRIWSCYSLDQAGTRAQICFLGLKYMNFWFLLYLWTVRLFIPMGCLLQFHSPIESECWLCENGCRGKKPNWSSVRRQGGRLSSEATHCGCLISQGTQFKAQFTLPSRDSRNEGEPSKICLGALDRQSYRACPDC